MADTSNADPQAISEPLSPRSQKIGLGIIAAAIGLILIWWFYFSPLPSDLRMCDQAIQSNLKAPSTYKRVDAPTYYSESGVYMITYEAENSFGVPLRSKGLCSVNADRSAATWSEFGN